MKNKLKSLRNWIEYMFTVKQSRYKNWKNHNIIKCPKTSRIRNTSITIQGINNIITIGGNCDISGLHILIIGNHNKIEIGHNVGINASSIQPTTINAIGGTTIKIGNHSLLSNNIEIHTSDYHGIYDYSGKRLNPEKNITIGERVWIGLGSKILKGTEIANGCIVGAGSILTRKYSEPNTILAGIPADIVKYKVIWTNTREHKLYIK